ncbi:MAG: radical SAM protein [Candidatus Bathyarchaeota archaeon]|jgi:DNA repair photolyase
MKIKEICAKTILSKSKISDYTINPYIGCEYACAYCYARFMRRFVGHKEKWGEFLDVKVNAPILLRREIKKKTIGKVWISGVCDPYQNIEEKYELTKQCLEILLEHEWPVTLQTKSPLILRDLHLIKKFSNAEVGLSIATSDEKLIKSFEPNTPSIKDRIETLEKLHSENIDTFLMIAPLLPNAKLLIPQIEGKVDYVLIDKMNYHHADRIYKRLKMESDKTHDFFAREKRELTDLFMKKKLPFQFLF